MHTGGSETAGQALRGCVYACVRALVCVGGCVCLCVHMLTHACVLRVCVCVCVCVNEWVVATAYPFRIPMKLNQHFSFVFGLALWAVWGPMKDIQQ